MPKWAKSQHIDFDNVIRDIAADSQIEGAKGCALILFICAASGNTQNSETKEVDARKTACAKHRRRGTTRPCQDEDFCAAAGAAVRDPIMSLMRRDKFVASDR